MTNAARDDLLRPDDCDEARAVGFIVHPTWYVRAGVTEIHLYGRLSSGETFLVIDTRTRPRFYLRASEAQQGCEIAARSGGRPAPTTWRTMDGEETTSFTVNTPNMLGALRRSLAEEGIRTYEADVPFAWAYLIDRHIRGSVKICGSWQEGSTTDRVYRNPTLAPSEAEPQLITASLSLDLNPQTGVVQAIALAGFGTNDGQEVLTNIALEGHGSPASVDILPTERDLLLAFRHSLCELDPDLITGWDIVSTVLVPLKERFAACGLPFNLGRSHRLSRVESPSASSAQRRRNNSQPIIEGRQILDARAITRSGQRRFDDLELATVSQHVLGYVVHSADQRARAVLDILAADDLIRLTVRRSLLIGIPLL